MTNAQVFRTKPPLVLLVRLLARIASQTRSLHGHLLHYVDRDSFKRGQFCGVIPTFLDDLEPHYFVSKRYFVQHARLSPVSFMTVVRQLCHELDLPYEKTMKYDKSKYEMVYAIKVPCLQKATVEEEKGDD